MQSVCARALISLLIVLPAFVLGCEGKDPHGRREITGTVTFRGQLLDGGSIKFLSTQGTGMSGGSLITKGKYLIPREQSLPPGAYRVLISALEPTPKPTGAPGEDPAPPAKERIPDDYNVASQLVVDVNADQENKFDFTIK